MRACAVILAAGLGRRMGRDKAGLDLAGQSALRRVIEACRTGGVSDLVVVRATAAAPLPADARAERVVLVEPGEMLDSVRAGVAAAPQDSEALLVFPVDYALVSAATVAAVLGALAPPAWIGLPLHAGRPGHPIALAAPLAAEIHDPETRSLRDVVARDRARVRVVPVADPWVRRDLDTREDLAAAVAWLAGRGSPDQ